MSSLAAHLSHLAGKVAPGGGGRGQPSRSDTILKNESVSSGLGNEAEVQRVYFQMQQERAKSWSGEPKQDTQASRQASMAFRPDCGELSYKGSARMRGKKCLVTGGDSGIGRAIAIAFAREGADVVICYRSSREDAEDVVKVIAETTGQKAVAVQADVRSREACKSLVERCLTELGGITTLVLNAGIQFSEGAASGEMKALGGGESASGEDEGVGKALSDACEHLPEIYATNLWSNFYLSAEAVKHFRPDTGCTITFITSVNAYKGHGDLLSYTSTKSAQVGLLRSLSRLYKGRLCRVNGIAPGPILTPLIPATWGSEKTTTFGQENPMGRAGQPVECACAAVYLASSDASYVSGQVLHVDGGMTTSS